MTNENSHPPTVSEYVKRLNARNKQWWKSAKGLFLVLMALTLLFPWWSWGGTVTDPWGGWKYDRFDFLWSFGLAISIGKPFGESGILWLFDTFQFGDFAPEVVKGTVYEPWVKAMLLPYEPLVSRLNFVFPLVLLSLILLILGEFRNSPVLIFTGSLFLLLTTFFFLYLLNQFNLLKHGQIFVGVYLSFMTSVIGFLRIFVFAETAI